VKRLLAALGLALAVWALTIVSSAGQAAINVDSADAVNQFPNGVTFSISLHSDSEISKVQFRYTVPPDGTNVYEAPECTSGASVKCTYNLKSGPKLFLVPGANVVYHWQAEDAAGDTLETEPATFVYEDDRFHWKSVSDGNLTLWYYSGSESEVRPLLQTGVEGLQRMEDLLATSVGFPVKVYVYATAEDMRPATLSTQDTPAGVITLGEVYFSDTAVVSEDEVPQDVLRHELAHIVTRQAVKGPFGNLPAWLDEGTAVYAQANRLSDEEDALNLAIKSNNVLSLRSMSSASVGLSNGNVSLFYGEAWSLVSFLVNDYGADKLAGLFAVFKAGSTVDKALLQVYGFDQDGMESAWRQSVGLPPKQATPEEGQGIQPLPTLKPLGGDGQQGGDNGQTASTGSSNRLLLIIIGSAVLGVLVLTAAGVAVARRSR